MNMVKKTWLRYLVLGLLAVMIGTGVYSLNASRLTGDQMPMPLGFGASVVLSGSMEPTLSVGDLLIVQKADAYEAGDIVVYQSGRMAVVHRVVEVTDGMVTTRGDANNAADEPFPVEWIKGEVTTVIPMIGSVVWGLKSPVGILLCMAAAVVLVELSFRSGKTEKETEKERIKAEIRALMEELKED